MLLLYALCPVFAREKARILRIVQSSKCWEKNGKTFWKRCAIIVPSENGPAKNPPSVRKKELLLLALPAGKRAGGVFFCPILIYYCICGKKPCFFHKSVIKFRVRNYPLFFCTTKEKYSFFREERSLLCIHLPMFGRRS